MEFLGKNLKTFRKQCHFRRTNRNLPGFCLEDFSHNTNHIAHIKLFERFVVFLPHAVSRHVGLNITLQILHIAEGGFSHHTFGHHTSCDRNFLSFQPGIVVLDFLAVMRLVIFRDNKRVAPLLLKCQKLLSAYL